MNVTNTGNDNKIQYRPDAAAVTQKKQAEQAQQDQKQAQAAQEAKKTNEQKQGSALKGGEINITA